ncbi:MAG: serine/threonine protein kinase [Verrucomicrobia bacterium]|nr:serine/threonine protein kinase [Verrucomicrobiota bacterium]
MSEQPNPEVAILNAALEFHPVERAAYLDQACAGDPALRQQVDALLQAHEQADSFLEVSPAGFDFKRTANIPLTEKPGDKIGRYKLLQQIGEGGCGVVYMAEQEEPVRRRVALKVIKLGMDTKQVIARFEVERQALALMDHPNIAKVFDAGSTERPRTRPADTLAPTGGEGRGEGDAISQLSTLNSPLPLGRPYFVMELVRGIKITEFCDENQLSTADRLKLFIQVCQAIQHAHQKGVIHRDIKPSNILVTVNDGVPVPKVIDFGIAKATQGRLTDHTLFTAFEQFIGTPAYMSPEQAVMTSLDIDTRSDIYSLGVLLYELLTGRTPFDQKELLAAGLDEMRRTIREKEPPKPSTVVERLSKLRVERGEAPASTLNSQLKSLSTDLDWIAMKCLEKDRTRRYETANGLARDIERHLNNEPVVARPPSAAYRFQKLVRRNKIAVAATSAVAAALIFGLGVSTWLFLKERFEHQHALAEAAKSKQVAEFLKDMLKGIGPSVALGRDTTMLREILDKTAERVGRDLTNQPEVEAELRSTIGGVYYQLAEYDKAEAMDRAALAIRRKVLGNMHTAVADSLEALGYVLWDQMKLTEAEALHREALTIRKKLLGNDHPAIASSLTGLADVFLRNGKPAEAEPMYREALAMRRRWFGNEHVLTALSVHNLADGLSAQGKLSEAETCYRDALAMGRRLRGNDSPYTSGSLNNLGDVLRKEGKLTEAESAYREALTSERKVLGDEHPNTVETLQKLAEVLCQQGKMFEAEPLARECLAICERKLPNDWQTFNARSLLGGSLLGQKKIAEAEPLLLSGYEGMKMREGQDPIITKARLKETVQRLVQLYEVTGRADQAAEWKQKLAGFDKTEAGKKTGGP